MLPAEGPDRDHLAERREAPPLTPEPANPPSTREAFRIDLFTLPEFFRGTRGVF